MIENSYIVSKLRLAKNLVIVSVSLPKLVGPFMWRQMAADETEAEIVPKESHSHSSLDTLEVGNSELFVDLLKVGNVLTPNEDQQVGDEH